MAFMSVTSQHQKSIKIRQQITAVVVTYNSSVVANFLADSLDCLEKVIIVDNASEDDTVEKIRSLAPHVEIIANNKNLGFGAANNLGAQSVITPFILFINPDCQINVSVRRGHLADISAR